MWCTPRHGGGADLRELSDPLISVLVMEVGVVPPRVRGEEAPVVPGEVVSSGLTDLDVVADIWSTDARMAREHAHQAAAIAELARRRRVERDRDFGARGGPGVDARALRPVALADVSDDFVTELAVIRGCSEAEASELAVAALLLTTKARAGVVGALRRAADGPQGADPAGPAR